MFRSKPGPLYAQLQRGTLRSRAGLRVSAGHRKGSGRQWAATVIFGGLVVVGAWQVQRELRADPEPPVAVEPAHHFPAGPARQQAPVPTRPVVATAAASVVPSAAADSASVSASAEDHPQDPERNPVRAALLRAAQDCVARRVVPVWASVRDDQSLRAGDVDLLARGLSLAGFPLDEAMIRHQAREPRKYAKISEARTRVALRRVRTTANVGVFLDAFAERLPIAAKPEDAPHWQPGDIVVVKPSRHRAKLMIAIVSARTDDDGVSLLLTLDPADKVARDVHTLDDYPIRHHFRLTRGLLDRARNKLGMPAARSPVTL